MRDGALQASPPTRSRRKSSARGPRRRAPLAGMSGSFRSRAPMKTLPLRVKPTRACTRLPRRSGCRCLRFVRRTTEGRESKRTARRPAIELRDNSCRVYRYWRWRLPGAAAGCCTRMRSDGISVHSLRQSRAPRRSSWTTPPTAHLIVLPPPRSSLAQAHAPHKCAHARRSTS